MLNLDTINFNVSTEALKEAVVELGKLQSAVSNLNTPVKEGTVAAERLALAHAKTAKASAEASKATADASLSVLKLATAEEKAAAAKLKSEQAQTKANSSTKESLTVLEKQQQILEYMTQGFSKGQATVMMYAKASGLLDTELKQLGGTLETQRRLVGGDTFDKSISGLTLLKNQYTEIKESIRQYNRDSDLTTKQTRELARDKERLIIRYREEGKSLIEVGRLLRAHEVEYKKVATAINSLSRVEQEKLKNDRDIVNATRAISKEDERMISVMQTLNGQYGTNSKASERAAMSIANYERNLRLSGVTGEEAARKLNTYRLQQEAITKAEEAHKKNYITAAVGPQITDIAVGLSTGQSLLTVMMQQGGQLRDQFAMNGVKATEMADVMRTAMSSMVTSIIDTTKAVGGMFIGGLLDAGSAIVNFISKTLLISGATNLIRENLASLSKEAGLVGTVARSISGGFEEVAWIVSDIFATSVAFAATAMIALGVAFASVIKEESSLSRALITTGASLGLSKQSAVEYAQSFNAIGISTSKAIEVIQEISKISGLPQSAIDSVMKGAVELEKFAGIPIEKTIESLSKFKDKPAEALDELAVKTGLVTVAEMEHIRTLEQQGKKTEAVTEAIRIYGNVTVAQAELIRLGLSPIEKLWIDITTAMKGAFEEIKNLARSDAVIEKLSTAFDVVKTVVSTVWYGVKQLGGALGGIVAILNELSKGNISGAMDVGKSISDNWGKAANEQQKYINNIWTVKDAQTNVTVGLKLTAQQMEKNVVAAQAETNWIKVAGDLVDKKNKSEEGVLKIKQAGLEAGKSELEISKAISAWNEKNKDNTPKSPVTSFYENALKSIRSSLVDAEAAQESYTKAQKEFLTIAMSPEWSELTDNQKMKIAADVELTVAEEKLVMSTKQARKEEEDRIKVLNKLAIESAKMEGFTDSYAKSVAKLDAALLEGTITQEEFNAALNKLTNNEISDNFKKITEELNKQILAETQNLELVKSHSAYLGLDAIATKKLNEETKIRLELEKDIAEINKKKLDPVKYAEAVVLAEEKAAIKRKAINASIANDAAEKLLAEYNKVSNGLTDVIVTSLTKGGAAGGVKLRDLIKEELMKPVTIVVKAVVDTVLGNLVGGIIGNALAGNAVTTATNALSSTIFGGIGKSALNWLLPSTSSDFIATGNGVGNFLTNGIEGSTGIWASLTETVAGFSETLGAGMGSLGAVFDLIPGWGWAIGGAIALISSLDDSGTYHTGGGAGYSTAGGVTLGVDKAGGFTSEYSEATEKASIAVSKSIVGILDNTASVFGKEAGYYAASAFADDTSEDGAWGSLLVKLGDKVVANWQDTQTSRWAPKEFADGEQGVQEYTAAIGKSVKDIVLGIVPDWAKSFYAALGDNPTVQDIAAITAQIQAFAMNIAGVTDDSLNSLFKSFINGEKDAKKTGEELADAIVAGVKDSIASAGAAAMSDVVKQYMIMPLINTIMSGGDLTTALDSIDFEKIGSVMNVISSGTMALLEAGDYAGFKTKVQGMITATDSQTAAAKTATGTTVTQTSATFDLTDALNGNISAAVQAAGSIDSLTSSLESMLSVAQITIAGTLTPPTVDNLDVTPETTAVRGMLLETSRMLTETESTRQGDITSAFADAGNMLVFRFDSLIKGLTDKGVDTSGAFISSLKEIKDNFNNNFWGDGTHNNLFRYTFDKWLTINPGAPQDGYRLDTQQMLDMLEAIKNGTINEIFSNFFGEVDQNSYSALPQVDAYNEYIKAIEKLNEEMAAKAAEILDPLKADIAGTVENPFDKIIEQAKEYLEQLDALGQATAENTAVVEKWQEVMLANSRNDLYNQLLSEEELSSKKLEELTNKFKLLGVTIPDSAESFRALLDGIDTSTVAGQKLYDALLLLIPGFNELSAASSNVNNILQERLGLERQLFEALGDTATLRALALAELDPSNRALQETIWALQDADAAVQTAMQAVTKAINAEKDKVRKAADEEIADIRKQINANQEALKTANDLKSEYTSIISTIKDSLKSLREEAVPFEFQYEQASQYLTKAIVDARLGSKPSEETLSDMLDVLTGDSRDRYSSEAEYVYAQAVQAGKLEELNTLMTGGLTESEKQVIQLEKANEKLEKQIESINENAEAQIEKLDEQLAKAQEQYDALKGIDNSVLSVDKSISNLAIAMKAYADAIKAAQAVTTTATTTAEVNKANIQKAIDWISANSGKAGLATVTTSYIDTLKNTAVGDVIPQLLSAVTQMSMYYRTTGEFDKFASEQSGIISFLKSFSSTYLSSAQNKQFLGLISSATGVTTTVPTPSSGDISYSRAASTPESKAMSSSINPYTINMGLIASAAGISVAEAANLIYGNVARGQQDTRDWASILQSADVKQAILDATEAMYGGYKIITRTDLDTGKTTDFLATSSGVLLTNLVNGVDRFGVTLSELTTTTTVTPSSNISVNTSELATAISGLETRLVNIENNTKRQYDLLDQVTSGGNLMKTEVL